MTPNVNPGQNQNPDEIDACRCDTDTVYVKYCCYANIMKTTKIN